VPYMLTKQEERLVGLGDVESSDRGTTGEGEKRKVPPSNGPYASKKKS